MAVVLKSQAPQDFSWMALIARLAFHKVRALKSGDRRPACNLETSIGGFRGSEIVKGSVGCVKASCWCFCWFRLMEYCRISWWVFFSTARILVNDVVYDCTGIGFILPKLWSIFYWKNWSTYFVLRFRCCLGAVSHSLTGPFTVLEPCDQEIWEFCVVQKRWTTDFQVPKLWKGRFGHPSSD